VTHRRPAVAVLLGPAGDDRAGQPLEKVSFGLRCSLPGLDVVSNWHCLALVCLRLGDAVAFGRWLKVLITNKW
jgi:hypothetical protein